MTTEKASLPITFIGIDGETCFSNALICCINLRDYSKSGNTDHHYYRLYNKKGEKPSITTKISTGEIEIDDFLIGEMSKQLKLNK